MTRHLLAVGALLLLAAPVLADDLECRNGGFPREQDSFALARVTGTGPLRFLRDTDGCPKEGLDCRSLGYVVPGDQLLLGRTHGAYVCAFFRGRRTDSAGWVPRDRVAATPAEASPAASAWVGRWHDGDDSLRLTLARDGSLSADGNAYWPSANPKDWPGGTHTGEITASARPHGARLHLAEGTDQYACQADLWLVGPLLVVRDNANCGGANVRFDGVYRRK